ncbi:MAG TPA: 16S rRNA (guanine(966)-N(2))-methyltransferase RsmD [Dehalococcoidia bacterium]
MRITGGLVRGQQLMVPKSGPIRPTTDRVREAIFSILAPVITKPFRGLDLYAGTGALGIEALSRSAEWIDFVEREPRYCAIIKQNLKKVGFSQKAHVYCCSTAKAMSFLKDKYDIVFMDPPYSDPSINQVAEQLAVSGMVDKETVVVISHASRVPLQDSYDGMSRVKEKKYGDTCISIYKKHNPGKGG